MATEVEPIIIAKYFLKKSLEDGSLITNLQMQKLVYFAYAEHLRKKNGSRLFKEKLEAWPNGPVSPSLYKALSSYGRGPIDEKFVGQKDLKLIESVSGSVKDFLDSIYDEYMKYTAFELVALTHEEKAWQKAREGLEPHESSKNPLEDRYILQDGK